MSVQRILVKGTENIAPPPDTETEVLELKRSYNISTTVRGIAETHDIALDKTDLVELIFNDETKWSAIQIT